MLFNPLFFKTPDTMGLKQTGNKSFISRKKNYLFSEIIKVQQDKDSHNGVQEAGDLSEQGSVKIVISGKNAEKIKQLFDNIQNSNSDQNKQKGDKDIKLVATQANLMQFMQDMLSTLSPGELNPQGSSGSVNKNDNIEKIISDITGQLKNTGSANLDIQIGKENIKLGLEKVTLNDAGLPGSKNLSNLDLNKLLDKASMPTKNGDELVSFTSKKGVITGEKINSDSNSIIKSSIELTGKLPGQKIDNHVIGDLKNVIDNNKFADSIKEIVIKKGNSTDSANQNSARESIKLSQNNSVAENISDTATEKKSNDSHIKIDGTGLKEASLKELTNILNSQNNSNNFTNTGKSSTGQNILQNGLMKTIPQSEIIPELSRFIKQGESNSITLKLSPESLGEIKISIDSTDKIVHAHIEVENNSVKQVIAQNINVLKTSLGQQGIQLGTFNVSLSGEEQKSNKSYTSKKKSGNSNTVTETTSTEETEKQKYMGYNTYEFLA